MGSFLGYIRSDVSNVTISNASNVQLPVQYACDSPSNKFSSLFELDELSDYIVDKTDQISFSIDNSITDSGVLSAILYLNDIWGDTTKDASFVSADYNKANLYGSIDTQYPRIFDSSKDTILANVTYNYQYFFDPANSNSRFSLNFPRLLALVRINGYIYFVGATTSAGNKRFRFHRLDGWENAYIYQKASSNYLTIEPVTSPRNVRPYTIEYKVKYNGEYIDNSEVTWELYLHQDGNPVENTDNVSLNNGVLNVGLYGSTSVFVKAIYDGYYAWASSSSVFIPYNPGGTSGSGGSSGGLGQYGGGSFGGGTGGQSSTSDNISGSIPTGSVNNSGASNMMFTRYLMTRADLDVVGEWLWSPTAGLNIAKFFVSSLYGSPMDSLLSLYMYPFSIGGYMQGYSAQNQIFCFGGARAALGGTAHMPLALNNNGVSFNWGSLKIDEFWGNFLDYAPHTTVELYLPWGVGFVQLDPNQVMNRTITVVTNIDLNKGTCVHNVHDDLGSVIGTYSGQCAKQLPLTALDNASKIAGITAGAVGAALSIGGAVTSGFNSGVNNILPSEVKSGGQEMTFPFNHTFEVTSPRFNMGAAKVAGSRTANRISRPAVATATAIGLRPAQVQRNGGFSDSSAFMGVQYPYIILSRPTQSVPEEYGHHYGYPSNIYTGLRYLSGYTEIGEIHLTGIPCTDPELEELDRVLKGGVLF